jgi:hypothetical protein
MTINLDQKLSLVEDLADNMRFDCALKYPRTRSVVHMEHHWLETLVRARKCHKKAGHYDRDALAATE